MLPPLHPPLLPPNPCAVQAWPSYWPSLLFPFPTLVRGRYTTVPNCLHSGAKVLYGTFRTLLCQCKGVGASHNVHLDCALSHELGNPWAEPYLCHKHTSWPLSVHPFSHSTSQFFRGTIISFIRAFQSFYCHVYLCFQLPTLWPIEIKSQQDDITSVGTKESTAVIRVQR